MRTIQMTALALASLLAGTARADLTLLVTPRAAGFEKGLALVRSNPLVLSQSDVFSPSEQAALRSLGDPQAAASVKLRVKDEAAFQRIAAWAHRQFPQLRVERNPEAKLESAAPFRAQWGLNNVGDSQRLDMDDITSIQIPGRAGEDIGLTRAPEERVSPAAIRVAILDSGIDLTHPALKSQILTKPAECDALKAYQACIKAAGTDAARKAACEANEGQVDSDQNGYPLDCQGWSIAQPEAVPPQGVMGDPVAQDTIGHGTHVAGIIGAVPNSVGIRGVLGRVNLIPVRVIDRNPNNPIRPQSDDVPLPTEGTLRGGTTFGDLLARGMLYAIRSKAQVVNLSLAWPLTADSLLMRKMVALAVQAKILVVASAGNDSNEAQVFPCAYPGVICVAAHSADGGYSHFSNYGPFVDVVAPGHRILSTWPMNIRSQVYTERPGYEIKNGTSMAAPMVTGVLARLLNDGFSPEEAQARLLLSARPAKASSLRNSALIAKDTRFGNVDLARAYQVAPQPLILPSAKGIVRLSWDSRSSSLPLEIRLKNLYRDASTPLEIRASITDSAPGARHAALAESVFRFGSWKSGEEKALATALKITHERVEGRLSLELSVFDGTRELNRFRIPLEITVNVDQLLESSGSYPITGAPLLAGSSLRSIVSQDPSLPNQYLAIARGPQAWKVQLVQEQASSYLASAPAETPAIAGELFQVSHLPATGSKPEMLVLIARVAPAQGSSTQRFLFRFLNRALESQGEFIFDNTPAAINDRFQWMKLNDQWLPAWIALGKTPPSELPNAADDPWDLNPADVSIYRFYYVTLDGKPHSVKARGDDEDYVSTLVPTPAERMAGVIPVVLAKGDGFEQTFTRAVIRDGKLEGLSPLTFNQARQLQTAPTVQEVQSLRRSELVNGTAFSGASTKGAQRTTIVPLTGTAVTFDAAVSPLNSTESVTTISGVFQGARTASVFAQTHYELQFHDLASGEVKATSLNRFSFLPAFIQAKSFFPMAVGDERQPGGERLPAVLIPTGLGDSLATEIIVPVYEGGRLLGLSRPAKLRVSDSQRCSSLGRPRPATATEEAQILFFCGDRIVRVPVTF